MLSQKTIRIAKFVITVASAGLTLVSRGNTEKIIDDKISKKVTEEISKRMMES